MRSLHSLALLTACVCALPAAAAEDPLSPLDFLLGSWSGGAPAASGTDVFQRDLDGHVLQRRSQSVIAAAGGKSQRAMQAQLTVYPTGNGGLAAVYFDNDGHVIHYDDVTVIPGRRVEFSSGRAGQGPGFRLTYALKAPGLLHVNFEMAPPGESAYRTIAEADETPAH